MKIMDQKPSEVGGASHWTIQGAETRPWLSTVQHDWTEPEQGLQPRRMKHDPLGTYILMLRSYVITYFTML